MTNNPLKNDEIKNRATGFTPTPRILHRLWVEKRVSTSAYCFYELLRDLMHYSKGNNKSIYDGIVKFSPSDLKRYVNRSYNTIDKWLTELLEIGAIEIINSEFIKINNYYELYKSPSITFHKNVNPLKSLNNYFDKGDKDFENIFQKSTYDFTKSEKVNNDFSFNNSNSISKPISPYMDDISISNSNREVNKYYGSGSKYKTKVINGKKYIGNAKMDEINIDEIPF